jgi:ATP-dependent Clp protease ATP-binding subunit ClpB
LIGKVGFDPVFGARPLKRIIQQYVENPLAQKILANEFIKGSSVVLDMKGEELSLKTTG